MASIKRRFSSLRELRFLPSWLDGQPLKRLTTTDIFFVAVCDVSLSREAAEMPLDDDVIGLNRVTWRAGPGVAVYDTGEQGDKTLKGGAKRSPRAFQEEDHEFGYRLISILIPIRYAKEVVNR